MNDIVQKIDKRAKGNVGVLDLIYKSAIKMIKKTCKTPEEFKAKSEQLLDTVCAQMGEEHREFYREYMAKMESES